MADGTRVEGSQGSDSGFGPCERRLDALLGHQPLFEAKALPVRIASWTPGGFHSESRSDPTRDLAREKPGGPQACQGWLRDSGFWLRTSYNATAFSTSPSRCASTARSVRSAALLFSEPACIDPDCSKREATSKSSVPAGLSIGAAVVCLCMPGVDAQPRSSLQPQRFGPDLRPHRVVSGPNGYASQTQRQFQGLACSGR